MESGMPDLSEGILYQKLQMLNCCIEKKRSREATQTFSMRPDTCVPTQPDTSTPTNISSELLTDDEDDEFFECNTASGAPSLEEQEEGPSEQPQGRLRKLEDLKLLNVDDDLYIPVTQEPAPMTEDMLAEHAEVLTR